MPILRPKIKGDERDLVDDVVIGSNTAGAVLEVEVLHMAIRIRRIRVYENSVHYLGIDCGQRVCPPSPLFARMRR